MTTNDMTPQPPRDHEPLGEVFREVFDLVDETVEKITDDDVEERLSRLLAGARRHRRDRSSDHGIFIKFRTDDHPLPQRWETVLEVATPVRCAKAEFSALSTAWLLSRQLTRALQIAQRDAAVSWAQANLARRDAHTYTKRAAEAKRAADAADEIAAAAAKRAARITAEADAQVNAALDRVSAAAAKATRTGASILAAAERDAARRAQEIVAAAEQRAAQLVSAAQQQAMWTFGEARRNAAQTATATGGHQPSSTTPGARPMPNKAPARRLAKPSCVEINWWLQGVGCRYPLELPRRLEGSTLVPAVNHDLVDEGTSGLPHELASVTESCTAPGPATPATRQTRQLCVAEVLGLLTISLFADHGGVGQIVLAKRVRCGGDRTFGSQLCVKQPGYDPNEPKAGPALWGQHRPVIVAAAAAKPLAALGVGLEHLERAALGADVEVGTYCVSDLSTMTGITRGWRTVRQLREHLLPIGYGYDNPRDLDRTIGPTRWVTTIAAYGNAATGYPDVVQPARYEKGTVTVETANPSATRLTLPRGRRGRGPAEEEDTATRMLLYHVTTAEIRAEVTLPDSVVDGYVGTCLKRIRLALLALDGLPQVDAGPAVDPDDLVVRYLADYLPGCVVQDREPMPTDDCPNADAHATETWK